MKRVIAVVSMTLLLTATFEAAARPDTRNMTCAQIKALISKSGSAVLSTGPVTYDRYVSSNGRACKVGQIVQRTSVPSRDGACPVFRCAQYDLSPG